MYNFFANNENRIENGYTITGKDFNHVKNVLRMNVGDKFLVSDQGKSHLCEIVGFADDCAITKILQENYQETELPIEITLFQGLPKSDKLELIIQKAVELGVNKIVPVETSRSIVKIEKKKELSKVSRWQAISESAAKQSKRNVIPTVTAPLSFNELLGEIKNYHHFIVPYENEEGMSATLFTLKEIKSGQKIALFIGPEGGFSQEEIIKATQLNAKTLSLGKRILRTETAAITALSALMLYAEINL